MDLTGANWRKSSRSGSNGGNCVEVATADRRLAVRDLKDRTGPALALTRREWAAFLGGVQTGAFDLD